jgi:transcriptional regulator GlxA family with amidase domain
VPDLPTDLIERFARLPASLALSPALEALARETIASVDSAPPAVPRHLAAAALWRYLGEAERGRPERRRPVDDALRFIHAQLEDPELSLGQIAAAAHVTPAHLVRCFRSEHATTPVAYLWQRRTALGIDLLTNTGLPIAVVASRCGFTSTRHFSRRVRLASGLPPRALRRARWGST